MIQTTRVWIGLFAGAAAIGAIAAVYGLLYANETIIAAGLPVAFVAGLLIPVMVSRANRQRRLLQGEGILAKWEYGLDEAVFIAKRHRKQAMHSGMAVAILLTVCLAVILLPFAVIQMQDHGEIKIQYIAAAASVFLLIWAAVPAIAAVQARAILRQPCVTVIGRNGLVVANRYHPLNGYSGLTAVGAELLRGDDGPAMLKVRYSFRAGRRYATTYQKCVEIPVPAGSEAGAERITSLF